MRVGKSLDERIERRVFRRDQFQGMGHSVKYVQTPPSNVVTHSMLGPVLSSARSILLLIVCAEEGVRAAEGV